MRQQIHRAEAALERELWRLCHGPSGWPVAIGGTAGVYHIPTMYAELCGILTHTVPTAAYRGAGRPEATYTIERIIDIAARELGISPYSCAGSI